MANRDHSGNFVRQDATRNGKANNPRTSALGGIAPFVLCGSDPGQEHVRERKKVAPDMIRVEGGLVDGERVKHHPRRMARGVGLHHL
jgi:hypothetical protein